MMHDIWTTLVTPVSPFRRRHTAIHGIDERLVVGAPLFPEIIDEIEHRLCLAGGIVVTHTAFDRISITRSCYDCQLNVKWLDSAIVARRAWPERYAKKGYGLDAIARDLGIAFRHHDAGEDARVAAEIVLRASERAGFSVEQWLIELGRCKRTSLSGPYDLMRRDGNKEGPLYGEVIAFTGALQMVRREAADLAAAAGCTVQSTVTKDTTMLVVGDQDIQRLAGHEKSAKYRKAEALIGAGQRIRIVQESDFLQLCSVGSEIPLQRSDGDLRSAGYRSWPG